ncbi:hypothetical protein [Kineococcus rhizosphaerae]|uniref:Uncharacterized protein n=1 Tax=Kineococcus rhizosphaerae TaxID=559628 RepID=A0A2T0R2J4_9ACTN|nr:hypothetical protein [Kineococcus rhizosphaerae]PRY13991.1 hypothetical protein CLV37_107110 [Kineococcus rhizosphaerae]
MLTPAPTTGVLRRWRAGAVSATVLGLAAGAHVAAGGRLPGPFLFTAVAVVVSAVCLLLAGRRLSWPVLSAVLGGGQLALHEVFDACSGPMATVVTSGHHQTLVLSGTADPMTPSPVMTGAHLLATVLAVVALQHGESLVWSLWAWLRPVVRVLLALVRFVRARVVPAPVPVVPRPRAVVARRVRRRGPPRVPALATTF